MATETKAEPWALEHTLHLLTQTEILAGSDGWSERRPTGRALAVCNCGYISGWVPRDELPPVATLLAEHGLPLTADGQGADLH